ncbi:MAG TPA: hypothetical protein VGH19_06710 [Verrucomicrobiae bacterium]
MIPSRIGFIQARQPMHVEQKGVEIVVTWTDNTGLSYNPGTGGYTGEGAPKRANVKGLVHFVTARSVLRQFEEIQGGDIILDTWGKLACEGHQEIKLTIDGEIWVMKELSNKAAAMWDTLRGDGKGYRTYLLRRET